ncbi:hypothetical protein PLICRDRAFT_99110 [Plicaturopsis crispa FD-325 SS-3]|nr:hypothetical protein PLICRDRAFT_99110 [Plicaturopsis crispa FD-325 SS-3]
MSAPPFVPIGPPPLPLGWSEHRGPNGQMYYYNAQTQESTYIRPLPAFPIAQPQPAKKKEKPIAKTPIPGTEWLRVKTTEGNVFYTHKAKKESVWTVPDEIKEALETLEQSEAEEQRLASEKQAEQARRAEQERLLEVERIKAEVQDMVKRKAEDVPLDEVVVSKKARVEEVPDEDADGGEESEESEEEEEWQREAAAQLAAEAEEEKKRQEEEARREKQAAEEEARKAKMAQLDMPARVDLSLEEAKALFKTLLREKDINPLHPWDTSLPLFVSDPRYVLLPSVSSRKEAFDEYCRDRARELRQSTVKKDTEAANPKDAYDKLLKAEVTSTRTSWNDFRRAWKKDRRFYGWGRDDKERERRFRDYIKELGEKKRAAAQKAEADFFSLLREKGSVELDSVWKDVKRKLSSDPRYDAVGSSSLREELFKTFLKALSTSAVPADPAASAEKLSGDAMTVGEVDDDAERERRRREKKERAVREREEKVKAQRGQLEADIGRSRMGLNKEEGEREFRTMLTDAVRDPRMTWDAALPQLKTDPRFTNSPLHVNQQLHLFHDHVGQLRAKHLQSLHALFESYAPSLAALFSTLPLSSLRVSLPVTKLGLDDSALKHEFEVWQRERTTAARKAFDEMLAENAFVEFWGRLGKIGGEGVEGGVKMDDDDLPEDEGEAGGGRVDMKALAKSVDVGEMEKVLKSDKRFIVFDHVPEQRERWLRQHSSPLHLDCLIFWLAMRLFRTLAVTLTLFSSYALADDTAVPKAKHDYQSDVARLRKIVVNSLYSHRDIFLRELVSNANDALEKLRLTALTDKSVLEGAEDLNITIKAVKNEDGPGGRIIITDTGIGMTPEELKTTLGTLAKSGTSDFLAKAETQDSSATGNLIGSFGLGFYSSFLAADRVIVSSVAAKTAKNPEPKQYVFSSSADDSSFEIYEDPRGNTLGRGTELTLVLKDEALEYLNENKLIELVNKHSSFSSTFPIYLLTKQTEEVPDETSAPEDSPKPSSGTDDEDEDSILIEDVDDTKTDTAPKTKKVTVEKWVQLNSQPPLWMRDPKSISDEEYKQFYQATFKDSAEPLAWHHFTGDSSSGVSFRAIIYLPSKLDPQFWQQTSTTSSADNIRLMVKRVFITSDLGAAGLPKWASPVKAVIDADDLELNVSRESLQSNRFLKEAKGIILKRLVQLFTRLADDEPEKFEKEVQSTYGSVLKLGAVEDQKNREKLIPLLRFSTNQRDSASLAEYVENKRHGQKQIFFLAELGKTKEALAKSVFVEKLTARGYEVLLLHEPLDEILVQNIRRYKNIPFQDVAKVGLKFGDEDAAAEEEKKEQIALSYKFRPLLDWLKEEAKDSVRDVVISDRLVSSPCAIVADSQGYTANMEKLMSASNNKFGDDFLAQYAKKQKMLEINPKSPLIVGLLTRVEQLLATKSDGEEDPETEAELKEAASILVDGALVRSGFEVADTNEFFSRVDRVLRRSLGVSETAKTDTTVKPAPPVDPELVEEEPEVPKDTQFNFPSSLKGKVKFDVEEIDDEGNPVVPPVHDEL